MKEELKNWINLDPRDVKNNPNFNFLYSFFISEYARLIKKVVQQSIAECDVSSDTEKRINTLVRDVEVAAKNIDEELRLEINS